MKKPNEIAWNIACKWPGDDNTHLYHLDASNCLYTVAAALKEFRYSNPDAIISGIQKELPTGVSKWVHWDGEVPVLNEADFEVRLRSKQKEARLAIALDAYTTPMSPEYDPEFDRQIRALRPDWFAGESK